jgi:hypothetical protein
MAKQHGLIRLDGSIGDMTYYKSKDGYRAKEKAGPTKERIASDPNFIRTRENMSEFGRAGTGGKLIRQAINPLLKNAKDSKAVSRLSKVMSQVIKSDTVNRRGERTVSDGDMMLLKGFEFNANAILRTTLYVAPATVIDRGTGTLTINIPAFVPSSAIIAPQGATHFKLVSAGAAIDFDAHAVASAMNASSVYLWDETSTGVITLVNTVAAGTALPLFVFLGIQFFQETNGVQYPLLTGSSTALSLIEVNVV